MIGKLSFKNMKKSIKDYMIYFFTLILGIVIFYVFNSIDSQTVMIDISGRKLEIIKLLNQVLSSISVFVSFILGSLIIYATRFMIKRRNKEFAIYLTLGMSKRKISFMLFLETLIIGIFSLIVGLFLGIIFSQGMSVLVAHMFECDMKKFQFVFSIDATIKTIIYFSIMYLIVMIFNTIVISKCKLIDLLHSRFKSEKMKIKNSFVCLIVFVLSCISLGYAYYLVTGGVNELEYLDDLLKPIIIGIISTFFIIWSLSGILIKIVSKISSIYYKKINIFTIRQLSSKINTMVISMSIICLMLFITICSLSCSFSLRNSLISNTKKLNPVDMQVMANINGKKGDKYNNKSIIKRYKMNKISYDEYLKEYVEVNLYYDDDFTFTSSLGVNGEKILEKYNFITEFNETVISVSDYNKIAPMFNLEEVSLKSDEYLILANYGQIIDVREEALKDNTEIKVFNKTLKPKMKNCIVGTITSSTVESNLGIFIVSDDVINEKARALNILTANYKESNKNESLKIDEYFQEKNSNIGEVSYLFKNEYLDSSIGLSTIITFLGIYLGIIFLISCAAILALKTLSEASDAKKRYEVLRKIGVDEDVIKSSLFKETLIFFMIPLILAIIHSIFGMNFALKILEIFGKSGLLKSIIFTTISIILIYGGYFVITYYCSKRIIK